MTKHLLKCWPVHFQAILDGRKRFEFRYNDRGFKVGDELWLQEWMPAPDYSNSKDGRYTGREVTAKVTYVLGESESQPEFVPDNWVIMSLEVVRSYDQLR